jgi:hypothetical protein
MYTVSVVLFTSVCDVCDVCGHATSIAATRSPLPVGQKFQGEAKTHFSQKRYASATNDNKSN